LNVFVLHFNFNDIWVRTCRAKSARVRRSQAIRAAL
jgi:hypothetical protein